MQEIKDILKRRRFYLFTYMGNKYKIKLEDGVYAVYKNGSLEYDYFNLRELCEQYNL